MPPEPPSAAWLFTIVELGEEHGGGPLMVEVPHTRAAVSVPLPVEVSLALGGSLVETARWFDEPPPPGAVFDGMVALSGSSPQLV
jgi:hypothetical protein